MRSTVGIFKHVVSTVWYVMVSLTANWERCKLFVELVFHGQWCYIKCTFYVSSDLSNNNLSFVGVDELAAFSQKTPVTVDTKMYDIVVFYCNPSVGEDVVLQKSGKQSNSYRVGRVWSSWCSGIMPAIVRGTCYIVCEGDANGLCVSMRTVDVIYREICVKQ